MAFKSYEPQKAMEIAKRLKTKYNITCDFGTNGYVAENVEKMANVFYKLFGEKALPASIKYVYFKDELYDEPESFLAGFASLNNTIEINKYYEKTFYKNTFFYKAACWLNRDFKIFLPDFHSSRHPAQTYAHEFAHCVHYNNCVENLGEDNASEIFSKLQYQSIPKRKKRMIARHISKYANENAIELLVERIAQDICKNLKGKNWEISDKIDVGYSDIFSRKWKYRYTSPQSYIDYLTQQIWNGYTTTIQKGNNITETILSRIPSEEVNPKISKFRDNTLNTPFEKLGQFLFNINKKHTNKRDCKNDIYVKYF
ncbi:MAG: hypothetical protein MJ237_00910 [bacterium]|nr:hypothetical protein [bacterium]